jgi:hypothetical protein
MTVGSAASFVRRRAAVVTADCVASVRAFQEHNRKLVARVDAHLDSSVFRWDEPNMRVGESTIIVVYRRETGR